jgi:isoleucyl-tRNA synthetase
MGIHHAWGRTIKDAVLRYKAMNGFSCHYRNGFDTQGLWVEVEVEKELGFNNKKDIMAYGMGNFTKKCVERIQKFSGVITEQSKRLGQWMDWDNSYFTHTDENISAIWFFLKLCGEKGLIAKAHRPMPWCPRCQTSLSQHEMAGSHTEITHTAVFAVAKLKDAEFDALVWTTTPWTLSANAALAVNPNLDYALAQCKGFERPLVLAKNAVKQVLGDAKIIKTLKGAELLGLEYETFFPNLPAQHNLNYTVIAWDDVDANEGSGIVHIAPGCGEEDYELGKKFSFPELSPLDEAGVFLPGYGFLSGKPASESADLVFEKLKAQGKLFKTHKYSHSYPVCWRCKSEVLYRLVSEWFIKTEEIKPQLIQAAQSVKWEPEFIGKRMQDWLNNMGDWNISRKRSYGLPLPFYPCDSCGHLTVIGSKDELSRLSGEAAQNLPELHRPYIDEVKIKCPKCGEEVRRVPEVGDVWLDAGIAPFSTLGYFTDRDEWEKNFPAEWIIEMSEQVRLWFYSQLFMSVVITNRAPYEHVQTNNWVVAEDGTKFSKTGYMIRFDDAADKMGADAVRYLFAGASPYSDVRFGFSLGEAARRKLLGFWNIFVFFMTCAEIDKPQINKKPSENLTDKWLESRVRFFVNSAISSYENYNLPEVVREFEKCVNDISNWYVRINRRRFWSEDFTADKQDAYNSLYFAIKRIAQAMAPILPFMTEFIWLNMARVFEPEAESVFLSNFPAKEEYSSQILTEAEQVREVTAQVLKLRNEKNKKVKQPLSVLYFGAEYKNIAAYAHIIRDEVNVKEIVFLENFGGLSGEEMSGLKGGSLSGNGLKECECIAKAADGLKSCECIAKAADGLKSCECIAKSANGFPAAINTEITRELKAEGIYREILRFCQVLRKDAGFAITSKVTLNFAAKSEAIREVITAYEMEIMRETLSEIGDVDMPVLQREVSINGESVVISVK